MVVRQQQQYQKEVGAQTGSVPIGVRSATDNTLNGVSHQQTPCSQEAPPTPGVLVDSVPMVALECELALSGRLSPPADPTAMPLPLQSDVAISSDGEKEEDPLPFPGHFSAPQPSADAGADRPGCKRKLPQSVEESRQEEDLQCASVGEAQVLFQGDAVVVAACERCGGTRAEERGSKRRRRSHECCDSASMKVEDEEGGDSLEDSSLEDSSLEDSCMEDSCLEDTQEQARSVLVEISHMDLSVEQTLDVITTSGHGTEQDSVLAQIPGAAPETEAAVAPLLGDAESADEGMDSSVQDFREDDRTTPEVPDSVVGIDIVVEASKDPAPSDPTTQLTSTAPCQQQHHQQQHHHHQQQQQQHSTDTFYGGGSGSGGDDASSEEGDNDNDAAFLEEVVCARPRPHRISPFLNTPKQRKEERRKVLKLSIHKMRAVEDPEHFLRRSVLINNTMKRLQRELREEKMRNSPRKHCYTGLYRRSLPFHYYDDALNHNHGHSYVLSDESFVALGDTDRITDDMTDALVTRLEAATSSSHHLAVVPTPSPSPSPLESEPAAAYLKDFHLACGDEEELCSTSSSSTATTTTTTTTTTPSLGSSHSLGACDFSDVIPSSTCHVAESMSVMMNAAEMTTSPSSSSSSSSSSSFGTELPSSCSSSHLSDDLMLSPMESSATSLEVETVSSSVGCELSSVSDMTSSSATDVTSSVPELMSVNCISTLSSFSSSSSSLSSSSPPVLCGGGTCGDNNSAFAVPNMVRECPSPSNSSCSSESQREKQLFTDIDVVFNNFITALGDS